VSFTIYNTPDEVNQVVAATRRIADGSRRAPRADRRAVGARPVLSASE
jgi:hypothetical protein